MFAWSAAHAAEVSEERRVEVVAGGGAASYAPITFASVGGEVRVRTVSGLRALVGVEAWGTRQIPPPDYQFEEGIYAEWSWMVPVHAGAVFQGVVGPIEPYGGADLVVVNHLPGAWSFGGRARAGVDAYFSGPVGVGVDLAVGAWSGKGWPRIVDGAKTSNLVAQGTAHVVLGF